MAATTIQSPRRWARSLRLGLLPLVLSISISAGGTASEVSASTRAKRFLATLTPTEQSLFNAWYAAQTFHDAAVDAYWGQVERKRRARRAMKRKRQRVTEAMYVTEFPPVYDGPRLPGALARRWSAFEAAAQKGGSRRPELPDLNDYLRYARAYFRFEPERVPEREFKRRYAAEALRLGLSKDQVVRVYALETSGLGTADMVAGIHPIRRTGRPISTAIGYAQLLAANTLNMLQRHGGTFEKRLVAMLRASRDPERRARLKAKIDSLRDMRRYVRQLPKRWSALQRASRTERGRGIHAINIDGDIGPWIQVMKLRNTKDYAIRAGRSSLTPEQLELMNLAGPGTGLEMMSATGSRMPTTNFFSRRAYNRNTIVRGNTAAELITALGRRMDENEVNVGAREFRSVFDELLRIAPPR